MSRRISFRALVLPGLVVALAVPAAAAAARPEVFHENFSDSVSDVDVCGINVDIVAEGVFNSKAFFDRQGNFVRFMSTSSVTQTLTADNGRSVVIRAANQYVDTEPTIDEAAGTITFVYTFRGLPEMIKTAHGPMLLRDAGLITFVDTFDLDTGQFVSTEILVNRGPHPEAESDFALFCEVITEALG